MILESSLTSFPKFNYIRSQAILNACRQFPCQYCGSREGVVAAHSNQSRHGKGRGIKASDIFVAALCVHCHYDVDQGKLTKEEKLHIWETAHKKTAALLKMFRLWPEGEPMP